MKESHIFISGLLGLSFNLFVGVLCLVFIYVPTEETMGIVQRIFYFHVPVAWVAFLAFFIVFLGSILYLWKRESKWDAIASSSAEVGAVFTTLVLITGSIWAKPIWGVWWTWEPRLTTALVLWLIYIAYLTVRSFATDEQRGARFAAVVGIVGFIDVPIVALAITLWRTQHPGPVIFQGGLTPPMLLTLIVCVAAFTTLYSLLLIQRVSMKNDEIEIKRLKELCS
ncbi:MAG: cytochrome c biogenesis protein CcsA [Dehalococcoidia bacterium]